MEEFCGKMVSYHSVSGRKGLDVEKMVMGLAEAFITIDASGS